MTFFHFINCVALAFAPYFIVFKYSAISEYSTMWKVGLSSAAYLGTQLVKMLALATFFPTPPDDIIGAGGHKFHPVHAALKCLVDMSDILGLHLVIYYNIAGKGLSEIRCLTAGLGWALADSIATKLVPFWLGARQVGFDWRYMGMAIDANLALLHYTSIATLVWLFSRHDLSQNTRRCVVALLAYAATRVWECPRDFAFEVTSHFVTNFDGLKPNDLIFLIAKAILSVACAISVSCVFISARKTAVDRR